MNLDTDLTLITKINSEWITDLHVKCKTVNLLKDNREDLDDLGYGNDCLDITPKARSMKEIVDKLDFIKIKKNFSLQKTLSRE